MRQFLLMFFLWVAASDALANVWQSCNGVGPVGSAASVCQDLVKAAGESYEFSHTESQDETTVTCYAKYKGGSGSPDLVGSACKIESVPGDGGIGVQSNVESGSTEDSEDAPKIAEARAARDALSESVAKLSNSKRPATVTAGYNTKTGEVAARACGSRRCAEEHVVDALGGNKANVKFTEAVRPRTGEQVPVCVKCEGSFGREPFPRGTTRFKSDE